MSWPAYDWPLLHFADACGLTFRSQEVASLLINTSCAHNPGQWDREAVSVTLFPQVVEGRSFASLGKARSWKGGVKVTHILVVDGKRQVAGRGPLSPAIQSQWLEGGADIAAKDSDTLGLHLWMGKG